MNNIVSFIPNVFIYIIMYVIKTIFSFC